LSNFQLILSFCPQMKHKKTTNTLQNKKCEENAIHVSLHSRSSGHCHALIYFHLRGTFVTSVFCFKKFNTRNYKISQASEKQKQKRKRKMTYKNWERGKCEHSVTSSDFSCEERGIKFHRYSFFSLPFFSLLIFFLPLYPKLGSRSPFFDLLSG